jgi:hypothetical protein
MNRSWSLPRRTFLKGLGATLALPWLEAMAPPARLLAAATGQTVRRAPLRLAFVYVPNGANMAQWKPAQTGADFILPSTLEPLKNVRRHVQVITGLAHQKAAANGDGAGDHARASATFLTGCQARKTAGADIRVGVSVDQVAAQRLGRATRLPSLELACDAARLAGSCDSGYACAYQFNLSWRSESTPMPPEVDPRLLFDRLFGNPGSAGGSEERVRREQERKSVLDFVLDDARRLQAQLGVTDRRKLDEYLTSVRELEQRIENAGRFKEALPDLRQPSGIPRDYEAHIRLMFDLLALAFQTDTTRIATFMLAHDGSNRPYPFLGISDGHHDLSHHQGKEEKLSKIAQINRFHATQFAYFLEKLRSLREGDGTVLDNCMIVYGSGISDGNRHNHDDLPVLLAGGGRGTLQPGRHLTVPPVPMTNLYLSLLDRAGAPVERLGDSTGQLAGL